MTAERRMRAGCDGPSRFRPGIAEAISFGIGLLAGGALVGVARWARWSTA